jgi:Protein of unknown function (DUF3592)
MKSPTAGGKDQRAVIKQNRMVRVTAVAACVILIPVLSYSLLQNHLVTRLKVSGVATNARITKIDRAYGEWWNGHPSHGTIILFKYQDGSGRNYDGWEKVYGFSAPKLNVGDQFPVWYDGARPNRFLTPWTDNSVEVRISSFIVLLVAASIGLFVVTKSQGDRLVQL